ncbi:MAG: AmmeMemoRadiSam system protein A [Anaerolineae bacterium]
MHPYVKLAHKALKAYLETGQILEPPPSLPPELREPQAVFVSLYAADGELRGCRGTTEPQEPTLFEAIVQTSIKSAIDDPRFAPMTAGELAGLKIKIDVLGPLEQVADLAELDPRRYGVLIQAGPQRALLLPDIPGIDTVDKQLAGARRKAGIPPDKPIKILRFSVQRYS